MKIFSQKKAKKLEDSQFAEVYCRLKNVINGKIRGSDNKQDLD